MVDHNRQDLRTFLKDLENRNELLRITKPADVQAEVPALCSQTTQAVLFDNLLSHENWRLTDCLVRDRDTQALALGCSADSVVPAYVELSGRGPGETCLIDDSPVKEVIWTGDDVNLHRLPVPIPSDGIAVPHLNLKPEDFRTPVISGAITMTKNPETGVHNCSFTMAKIAGERRTHCYVFSPHTWANVNAYGQRGERAPMALVIGCHPIYELAAAYTGPHDNYSEIQIAAGMLNEPIALTRCETIDLEVPAYAEIVIEGFVDPEPGRYVHTSAHTDTHTPFISSEPFFDVTAITMRKDPIYRHIQPTRFTDHHALCEFIVAPMLFNILKGKGLDVHDVHVPLQSRINCAVIQMTPNTTEESREALLSSMGLPFFPRVTIVVDRDIDIYDMKDVLYALSIRMDPAADIVTFDGVRSFNLEPIAKTIPGLEDSIFRTQTRCGIDATKPGLSQPEKRVYFERLTPRGGNDVRLEDFLS